MNNLNFTLLSDVSGEIANLFGVDKRKGGSFNKTIGEDEIQISRGYTLSRWTFILDKSGKIIYKDTESSFNNDHQKVIDFLKEIKK